MSHCEEPDVSVTLLFKILGGIVVAILALIVIPVAVYLVLP